MQLLLKESFSIANVWEAKKKPTSAEKTIMIKTMIKMKGVILKQKFDIRLRPQTKQQTNLQPPSSLFCKERKGKQKEEFHSVLYSEFDQQSALSANYWFIAETVQVQSCKVITFLQEG